MRFFIFLFIWIPFISFSQDIIVKKNGDEVKTKIIEITEEKIKYKEFDFQDGPLRNIEKSQIFMILYQNGNRENFVNKPNYINKSNYEEKTNSSEKAMMEVVNEEKNDKFYIIGIDEKYFVRSDYEGELIESNYFVFNLARLEEGLWNPYRKAVFEKTGFELLPPSEQFNKNAYSFVDFEIIKNKLEFIIKDEIGYAFSELGYLKHTIENMVVKVLNSMQDNSDNEPCTVLGITIPIELNPNNSIKPKKLKTRLVEFLFIPYVDKEGTKRVRIYNSSKIEKDAFNYELNKEIGEKDCYLCTESVMLKNIKTWYDKEYLLEINENSPNKFINFSN